MYFDPSKQQYGLHGKLAICHLLDSISSHIIIVLSHIPPFTTHKVFTPFVSHHHSFYSSLARSSSPLTSSENIIYALPLLHLALRRRTFIHLSTCSFPHLHMLLDHLKIGGTYFKVVPDIWPMLETWSWSNLIINDSGRHTCHKLYKLKNDELVWL